MNPYYQKDKLACVQDEKAHIYIVELGKKIEISRYDFGKQGPVIEAELRLVTVWDEFWSYVGKKSNQRWTWYLINRANGDIIAWENGRRTDEIFLRLLQSVAHIPIKICYTDDWASYSKYFPEGYIHFTGKDDTWKIERRNLNFRTHIKRLNRKTICFSKKDEMHDKVISMYIEKYYFQQSIFNRHAA